MSSLDDPRVYFAAERTLLAWVRTGLALMGFGAVLGKQILGTVSGNPVVGVVLGAVLCGLGATGNLFAVVQFVHVLKSLSTTERPLRNSAAVSVITAVIVGLLGLALIAYIALP